MHAYILMTMLSPAEVVVDTFSNSIHGYKLVIIGIDFTILYLNLQLLAVRCLSHLEHAQKSMLCHALIFCTINLIIIYLHSCRKSHLGNYKSAGFYSTFCCIHNICAGTRVAFFEKGLLHHNYKFIYCGIL